MPEIPEYDPVLSGKAVTFLTGLSKTKQKQVIALIMRLAAQPFLLGDYSSEDAGGRRLENLVIESWHFTYWADHSAQELRIVDLTEI